MKLVSTSEADFRSTVASWIEANSEVFVVIRLVFGDGAKSFEFFTDFERFLERIAELKPADSVIVMRDKQLPLRGRVEDNFVARALATIPDGADWIITCLEKRGTGTASWYHYYPGNSHVELEEELRDDYCFGERVAVGLEPPYGTDSDAVISAYVPNEDGSVTLGAY